MALSKPPFDFVRASYTVTRDGPILDVNRKDDSQRIHQSTSKTDAFPIRSNGLKVPPILSAHASRDSGCISTTDSKVLPKPSELKPRQLKRKRKQDAPVVLDHLAQLRRKQHGFDTGKFSRHHGNFFGGTVLSQPSTSEDLDVQAVPCSPNLKRVRPSDSVYDAVETANNGYQSFKRGESTKLSLPTAVMELSTTPSQQLPSPKITSEYQPLYSGIHFSGSGQVPKGHSNDRYCKPSASAISESEPTRVVLKTGPVQMDCTGGATRSGNASTQDAFVTSVEQPHCSYSRPHQLWSRRQMVEDCTVPLSSSSSGSGSGLAGRVTDGTCSSLSPAGGGDGALLPVLQAPSQTSLEWGSDEDDPLPPSQSLASLPTAQAFLSNPPLLLPTPCGRPTPPTATRGQPAGLMLEQGMEVSRSVASQNPVSAPPHSPLPQVPTIPSSSLHSPQMSVRRSQLNDSLEDFRFNFSENATPTEPVRRTSCLTDEESPLIPWEE